MNTETVDILGCNFCKLSTFETLEEIEALIRSGNRRYLCTVNVAILMMMRENARLALFISKSGFVVADGQPIIWASKYIQDRLPDRITGVELVPSLAEIAEKNSWGIYLMGGRMPVVQAVADKLKESYPSLIVSGISDGYFDFNEVDARRKLINDSGARILITAMGVPRQEYFLEESWPRLDVNFAVGVGGSFDVIAGITKRAPKWMQVSGMEWLYRLIQEPKRLFKRYMTTNTRFIYLFIKEIVFGHKPKKSVRGK